MRARTIWQGLMLPPWRFVFSRWPWIGLLYVLFSAVLFVVMLPVVAVTLLFLPLWGILLGSVERFRLRMLDGVRRQSGHVRVPPGERHNWLNVRLTEPATWREVVSLLTGLVFGLVALAVLLAQAIAMVLSVALAITGLERTAEVNFFFDVHIVVGAENWWHPLLALPVWLLLFGYANSALAALQGACISWLIAPRATEIDRRVEQLTRSRAAIVVANESERRRIERDLHDGVQQELVAIAARLGILELELRSGDADAVHVALLRTQDQTERALESLRETVRGIHPVVLTDHGLPSALTELSGRSPLPLRIVNTGFPRLSPAAEAAGYFLVSEAVTNATKHTVASRITIELGTDGDMAYISAMDDGHGGADEEAGSGISGLIGRAETLGGTLTLTSPPGGPTILHMRLPLTGREAATDPPREWSAHADSAGR